MRPTWCSRRATCAGRCGSCWKCGCRSSSCSGAGGVGPGLVVVAFVRDGSIAVNADGESGGACKRERDDDRRRVEKRAFDLVSTYDIGWRTWSCAWDAPATRRRPAAGFGLSIALTNVTVQPTTMYGLHRPEKAGSHRCRCTSALNLHRKSKWTLITKLGQIGWIVAATAACLTHPRTLQPTDAVGN
jgi:hypothetical protein